MNDRKQRVIKTAHKLFVDKGYQSTSIQDILDSSGISKGTFYNYFASKSELLTAIFKNLQLELDKERNEILIGHDPSDIEIFIKQLAVNIRKNRRNKMFFLFNEVFLSKEPDLIRFLQQQEFIQIKWLYNRLIDIFGKEKKPILFDCSIMFISILQQSSRFYYMDKKDESNPTPIIRFCVNRLIKLVEDLSESGEQLLNPYLMDQFLPNCDKTIDPLKIKLKKSHLTLMTAIRENIIDETERTKYWEMIDFVQDELIHAPSPRKHIVESVLHFLLNDKDLIGHEPLNEYSETVTQFFLKLEGIAGQNLQKG
ncbi:TetR/AcrR family transcriptional regulator [Bacillus sp. V3B]|uniref:TetR/AcrR family transcriptional regulator n=1 Tax=Bacillus sp. V3B TaxID=2804915 RepID=UPI00210CC237|nr:TetR/AcrR family transcriptional regulator [Bacillus sp. V3B]MCQ6275050.1 TetR/AcrR family transcriptional regulator [Bacillus sp. V3B]